MDIADGIHFTLPWSDDNSGSLQSVTSSSRYVGWEDSIPGTIVHNVKMPYVEIHHLVWRNGPTADPNTIQTIRNSTLTADMQNFLKTYFSFSGSELFRFRGSGILFNDTTISVDPAPPRDSNTLSNVTATTVPINSSILAQPITLNLVVLVGIDTKEDCGAEWGDLPMARTDLYFLLRIPASQSEPALYDCFAIATVNMTMGIKTFRKGKYITKRVIEGIPDGANDILIDDPWAETFLRMVPAFMNLHPTNEQRLTKWDLTDHSTKLIIQSYSAARSALAPYPPAKYGANWTEMVRDARRLKAEKPSPFLQGKVSWKRVYSWLAISLLYSVSGCMVVFLERYCDRTPIIDIGSATLFTDCQNILEILDENELSNMSYLTKEDEKALGILRLEEKVTDTNKKVFALTSSKATIDYKAISSDEPDQWMEVKGKLEA